MSLSLVVDIGTNSARVGASQSSVPEYQASLLGETGVWDSTTVDFDQFYLTMSQSNLLPQAKSVLVVESAVELDSYLFKSKLCEMVFESHPSVQHLAFQFAPVLTSFASARQSALVLDMSAGGCTATAVVDGWMLRSNRARSDFGYVQLDAHLHDKANAAALANYQELRQFQQEREYTLPDSTKVQQCLFECDGGDSIPLPELILLAATRNNIGNETRKQLLYNITPCGGLFLHDIIAPRLLTELRQLFVGDASRNCACLGKSIANRD
ncbi:hypothetical protein BASA81_004823 [Batrachochytrium salamandrivorans]|nr:hypothetical protein BASA81_004823 [Batrachochytrium salamandrivorans]